MEQFGSPNRLSVNTEEDMIHMYKTGGQSDRYRDRWCCAVASTWLPCAERRGDIWFIQHQLKEPYVILCMLCFHPCSSSGKRLSFDCSTRPKMEKKSLGKVLERPLQKKQSRNKYGWTSLFCLGGDDFQSRIWNLCIKYFHTKAQKLQKVYWATKLNRMRRQGAVELDVGNNFASREIHCAVVLKREQGRL